jgi:Fe2+ transport system protein FeoA
MLGVPRGFGRLFDRERWHRRMGRHAHRQIHACVDGELVLSRVPDGTLARVLCLRCGEGMQSRLDSMGIVPGAVVEKRSSALRRGPVLVSKGPMQLALAFDVAERIIVEAVGP